MFGKMPTPRNKFTKKSQLTITPYQTPDYMLGYNGEYRIQKSGSTATKYCSFYQKLAVKAIWEVRLKMKIS